MLQRIMIAGAMMAGPRLLICDESTTALDVTTQAEVVRLLSEALRERGMGMLFITHDLGLAASLADRVYVLRHGRIEETGSTRDVFENASAAYTRELIAAHPGLNLERLAVRAPDRDPAGPDTALVELRGVRRTYETPPTAPSSRWTGWTWPCTTAKASASSGSPGRANRPSAASSPGSSPPTPES